MTGPSVSLSYFTVTQPSVVDVESNTGSGGTPTVVWAQGTVTFTPSIQVIGSVSLNSTVYLEAIVGYFVGDDNGLVMPDGTVGVQLVDNVGLGLAAHALKYRVDYRLNVSGTVQAFMIEAPGTGGTVNLNDPSVHLPIT